MPAGETVVIEAVTAPGEIGERLLEMGLTPGTVVEVVRRAPFGDPLQIRVRGSMLALRRAQAHAIQVRRSLRA
jgi:ferrous iron transport protein A